MCNDKKPIYNKNKNKNKTFIVKINVKQYKLNKASWLNKKKNKMSYFFLQISHL